MNALKMRNIGPKSAAWLRQVGLRTPEDVAAVGSVEAFMRVKRAGFKLEATSDLLRNPADDHSLNVFDPKIRGNTDRVILKFRRPR